MDIASIIKKGMSLSFHRWHAVLIKGLLKHVAVGDDDKLTLKNYAKDASFLI